MDRNPPRVPDTCDWLLRHEKYLNWITVDSGSLLWVSADPGCGKSVLAKFLVTHLREQVSGHEGPRVGGHFFFKDDNEGQRSAVFALRAVLHQIFSHNKKFLRYAFHDYESKGAAIVDDFDILWGILSRVAVDPAAKDLILILDALDECEAGSQRRLLQGLRKWFSDDNARPFLKIIALSRPNNIIEDNFSTVATIRLRREDEPESISNDVELVIRNHIGDLASKGLPAGDLSWLQEALIEKADRTFLWTALMIGLFLDAARDGFSRNDLEDLLGARNIDEIYFKLLSRGGTEHAREETRKLLQVILAAAVPLSLDQLNVAVAADPKHSRIEDFNRDLKSGMDKYVKYRCGNFVRIIRSEVFLVHQTAREFLLQEQQTTASLWSRQITIKNSNEVLLRSCISSLLLVALEAKTSNVHSTDLGMPEELSSFFVYASECWSSHIQEGPVEMFNQIVDTCLAVSKRVPGTKYTWLPAHNLIWWLSTWELPTARTKWSVLELPLARLLDDEIVDVNACDSPGSGQSLLHRAAQYGFTSLSQTLLEHGADVSLKDNKGNTPLHLMWSMTPVTERSQDASDIRRFIRICLDHGADINARNNQHKTPLHLAAEHDLAVALQQLLETGASVSATTHSGQTPLQLAVHKEFSPRCISLLLEYDWDPSVSDLHRELDQCNSQGVLDVLDRDSSVLHRKEVRDGVLGVLRRRPTMTDVVGMRLISEGSDHNVFEDSTEAEMSSSDGLRKGSKGKGKSKSKGKGATARVRARARETARARDEEATGESGGAAAGVAEPAKPVDNADDIQMSGAETKPEDTKTHKYEAEVNPRKRAAAIQIVPQHDAKAHKRETQDDAKARKRDIQDDAKGS